VFFQDEFVDINIPATQNWIHQSIYLVFRIRIGLNTDLDPAFKVNTDPDPDPA